jgi:3-oxoadipate enol-lactonase
MHVVFIHGAGCTAEVFDAQRTAFPQATVVQLPGHGIPGEPASVEAFADAVLGELEDGAVLVGHSMGGAIALECALRADSRVRAVVMLGSGARLRVGAAIFASLETDFRAASHEIPRFFFAEPTEQRLALAADMMQRVGQAQTIRDFRACDAFDRIDRLADVAVPFLALAGDQDVMTPAKFSLALADRVPGGQARILAGAGHLAMVERPGETNAALNAFVNQLHS